ncbi:MAG: hypothetical protein ACRDOK_23850 [Streptosporangiaceae bacterium]
MLWDRLRLDGDGPSGDSRPQPMPLFGLDTLARTIDTPEFRGITFHEVRAKSIMNRVPDASRVPFRWTINPYRGCSHACSYCMVGETPIMMGDGNTKALAEVRSGDRVYGTVRSGSYRRYVITDVLVHWSVVKPAYQVTLGDGTRLICSGDHRFLTGRGWKYVLGTGRGPFQRPHLTVNNKLMGVGAFAEPPKPTAGYRRGYLCGMIRGDGHVGLYSYAGRGRQEQHCRFRLALVDSEPLDPGARLPRKRGYRNRDLHFRAGHRDPASGHGNPLLRSRRGHHDPMADPLAQRAHAGLEQGLPGGHIRRRG